MIALLDIFANLRLMDTGGQVRQALLTLVRTIYIRVLVVSVLRIAVGEAEVMLGAAVVQIKL